MSDLIKRDDVLEAFNRLCDTCGKKTENNGAMCRACSLDDAIDIVEDIPNAETTGALDDAIQEYIKDGYILAEPKVGKWIDDEEYNTKYGYYFANCSECGYQMDVHENRGYHNYCPNCGAKMEGRTDDD